MNDELLNNILMVLGGVVGGILINTCIIYLRRHQRRKRVGDFRPVDLGCNSNNPINRNANYPAQWGEKDEYGFIRL